MEPEEIEEKVKEVAEILELTPYLYRKPKSYSSNLDNTWSSISFNSIDFSTEYLL